MRVSFPPHLRRFLELPATCTASGSTVREVVADLDRQFPGVRGYLLEDSGALRQHVNIFIGEAFLKDRLGLSDPVNEQSEIFVMQALSGG